MATNPYTPVSISNYNNSPPPDDGTQSSANEITWAKHKTKLTDPLKTALESLDTNVNSAFDSVPNLGDDESNQFTGSIAFGDSELTVASGSVTPTRTHHTIDTEGDAGTDDLDTIATGSVADGAILILRAENTAHVVTVKHEAGGAGQIHLGDEADYDLDDADKSITLQRWGADWYEIARSQIVQQKYIHLQDQKADGTDGDALTAGAWTKATLNTEVTDTGNNASLSSSVVTLSAGTYELEARMAIGQEDGGCRLRFRNTTDSSTAVGNSLNHIQGTESTTAATSHVELRGRFSITASKSFELQYFLENSGQALDDNVTAGVEVYADVILRKVA